MSRRARKVKSYRSRSGSPGSAAKAKSRKALQALQQGDGDILHFQVLHPDGSAHSELSLHVYNFMRKLVSIQTDQPDGIPTSTSSAGTILKGLSTRICSIFVPSGYPESVAPEYMRFQAWDTVQALCSYLRGVLSTRAILEGAGLGAEEAALAATVQWIYRDGMGMLGGLLFAYVGAGRSKYNFDANIKFWRLFADVSNDVGLTLELLSPLVPEYYTLMVCLGSVFKSMCGVAAGSTRTAITSHFALQSNQCDVSAKEGSQETLVTLVGMLLGLVLTKYVSSSQMVVWSTFFVLTVIHVIANYIAVSSLQFHTINASRLYALYECFTAEDYAGMTPAAVGKAEPILTWKSLNVRLGSTLEESDSSAACDLLENPCALVRRGNNVHVLLRDDATVDDIFKALYKALFILEDITRVPNSAKIDKNAELFLTSLKKFKWDLDSSVGLLGIEGYKIRVIRE